MSIYHLSLGFVRKGDFGSDFGLKVFGEGIQIEDTNDRFINLVSDAIENNEERLIATIKEIERIIKLSDEDIAKLYKDCYDILTHNFWHWVYRQQTIHTGLKNDLLEILNV